MIPRKAKRDKMSWVLNWLSDFKTESEFFSLYSADHGQEVRLREAANFLHVLFFNYGHWFFMDWLDLSITTSSSEDCIFPLAVSYCELIMLQKSSLWLLKFFSKSKSLLASYPLQILFDLEGVLGKGCFISLTIFSCLEG